MMLAFALVAAATPIERRDAEERCAEAVIDARHPNIGMADMTATKFTGLRATRAGDGWTITGSIVEPEGKARIARRFTCRVNGETPVRVSFGKVARV